MTDVEQVKSALILNSIAFDEFHFKRIESTDKESHIGLNVIGPEISEEKFSVTVQAKVCGAGIFELELSLKGVFSVAGGLREENYYMLSNAVAIMFPYLRSEVTLLTSQPDMNPVVLPPINVHKLMEDAKNAN